MQEKVKQLIEGHDKVRYYILCEGCQQKISGTRGHPSALLLRRWIV
jgi:hypothetical protein